MIPEKSSFLSHYFLVVTFTFFALLLFAVTTMTNFLNLSETKKKRYEGMAINE